MIEFKKSGLPTNEKELGEHIEDIRSAVQAGGKATEEALERIGNELKEAHENVERVKKLEAVTAEQDAQIRTLHEATRKGGSDENVIRQIRNLPRIHKVEKDEEFRGKVDAGIFNLLAMDTRELRKRLDDDAFKAVMDFRRLNDESLMAHQITGIMTDGELSKRENYARSGGIKGTELWSPLQEAYKVCARALSTSTAGAIAEWIPTLYSANAWDDVRDQLQIAGQFDFMQMPSNPFILPTWLGAMTAYLIPEATSNTAGSNTAITASDLTAGNRTLTAKKLATLTWFSPESEQDSIVALAPRLAKEINYAQAFGVENAILNGQSTATIDTGSAPGSTDVRAAFDGLRYNASLSGTTVDLGAGLTADKLAAMIEASGRYADPANCFFGTGYKGLARALVLKDGNGNLVYLTRERAGDAATLFTGSVGILMGYPLVISGAYPQNMNASGVIDGVTATKSGFLFCNKRMFQGATRLGLEIESSNGERFSYDQMAIRSKQRLAFRSLVAASASRAFAIAGVNL